MAHPLHKTYAWKKRRRLQLMHEPLCAQCLRQGKVVPAQVVDHIEPHHGDVNSFRLGKLQSLCESCHNSIKQQIEKKGFYCAIDVNGWPIDRSHPVYDKKYR